MKMTQKTRTGSKVTKRYDKAKTPYHRILESPDVPQENKDALMHTYDKLNPAQLKRDLMKLQDRLLATNDAKTQGMVRRCPSTPCLSTTFV